MTPQELAATHAAAFFDARGWSPDEFKQLLSQRGVILSGDATSFVLGRVIVDEAEVLTVATDPDFQGQGRAHAAMAQFLGLAQAAGADRVFLEVAEDNTKAKLLYYKHNFSISGRRPQYYKKADGQPVDGLLMELKFSDLV